jgi:ribose-phosphate pyrophosphokinase
MSRLIYALPGNEAFAELLAFQSGRSVRPIRVHRFPDGESLVTVEEPPADADIILVCTLDRPDAKFIKLLMAADTLRDYVPRRIVLVAAYMPYMRQDMRFHPGEAVSSQLFGTWLSAHFDAIITVDPHLHRHANLAQSRFSTGMVVPAAPAIASWIQQHLTRPLIIGPDEESRPCVLDVANRINAPSAVANKKRLDDNHVEVVLPSDLTETYREHTPVVVDDILSTGRTMANCVRRLTQMGMRPPICVATHGVFSAGSREVVLGSGAARIVTTNTIDNPDAHIDITGCIADLLNSTISPSPASPPEEALPDKGIHHPPF